MKLISKNVSKKEIIEFLKKYDVHGTGIGIRCKELEFLLKVKDFCDIITAPPILNPNMDYVLWYSKRNYNLALSYEKRGEVTTDKIVNSYKEFIDLIKKD